MRLASALSLPVLLFVALTPSVHAASKPASKVARPQTSAIASYAKVPLSFEANRGQSDPSVQFLSRGQGYNLFLRPNEILVDLRRAGSASTKAGAEVQADQESTIRLRLVDADPSARATRENLQITKTNYFIGNDPSRWLADIPNYGRIRYSSIYQGIDLVYYGNQGRLEHDFLLAPNADPARIAFAITGDAHPRISENGDLLLSKAGEPNLSLLKPVAYQIRGGARIPVKSSYRIAAGNRIGFAVGKYDHTQPLVIDPVLSYSTFLGGSGIQDRIGDQASGIAVDSDGNAYIVGTTVSSDFPVTSGAYQSTNKEHTNQNLNTVFVTKLNATGTALIYSTLLGGTGNKNAGLGTPGGGDLGLAIALDANKNVYLTGQTYSSDFPTTSGAFQTTNKAFAANTSTAFVTKLDATGSSLAYSTYLGGTNQYPGANLPDGGTSIAVDSLGSAYITGNTYDADFPVTPGAFQATNRALSASSYNAFVTKLNPAGSALVYSTYLGGSGQPYFSAWTPSRIAIDSLGNAYVTGRTYASDFPVTSAAFQKVNHAFAAHRSNAYVTKLNQAGTALVYSTYLGGSQPNPAGPYTFYLGDYATAIAVDGNGSAFVAGAATSKDFPVTSGVVQKAFIGNGSAFVTKLDPTGSALEYSTFLGENIEPFFNTIYGSGTSGSTSATGIAIDASRTAYVSGVTSTPIFPSTQDAIAGTGPVVFAKLSPDASAVLYATAFGPNSYPAPTSTAIAADAAGNAYVTGYSGGTTFPTTSGAYQTINKAAAIFSTNAFVTKLALAADTSEYVATSTTLTSASSFQQGQPLTLTAKVTANSGGVIPTGTVTFSGFYENNSGSGPGTINFSQTVALDATGTANLVSTTFPDGHYSATAYYSGDASHLTSQGPYIIFYNLGPPANVYLCYNPQLGYLKSDSSVYTYPVNSCTTVVRDSNLDPLPGVTVTFSGANLAFSPTSAVTDANGTIPITVKGLAAGNTTAIATVAGVAPSQYSSIPWSVLQVPLTVTVNNSSRSYGVANPNFGYTISGLRGSDTVTVTPQTTATPSSPIGSYPITATIGGAAAPNYQVTVNDGTLSVLAAPLYISAKNVAMTYGQTPPALTAYTLTGFVNGDTAGVVSGAPILSTSVTSTTPVGFYPIGIQIGTLTASNYSFNTFSNGMGSVGVYKAPLTIRPDSYTIHVGDPLPTFTYTITGFANGETQATATTGAPVLTTTAPSTSTPGRYYIIATTGTLQAHNYAFARPGAATNGILTILK